MVTSSRYAEALRRLYAVRLFHPKSVGLANMHRLYRALDSPLRGVPIVHVTGTNGKGSVSVKVAEGLRVGGGLRAGLFTSPHIASFRERVQVDGELISQEHVLEHLQKIQEVCERESIPSTFFEIVTALACLEFRRARVDAAVFEVGIGGRLDATNVLDTALSVITSVQMDHASLLGSTRSRIAAEKAGIFKKGVDALVAPGIPWNVVERRSAEVGAPLYRLEDLLKPSEISHRMLPPPIANQARNGGASAIAMTEDHKEEENEEDSVGPLPDDAEKLNIDIARASLRLFHRRFGQSLLSHVDSSRWECQVSKAVVTRPPCRFEAYRITVASAAAASGGQGPDDWSAHKLVETEEGGGLTGDRYVVLDIAHNEAALLALSKKIQKEFPNHEISVVFGICSDKDVPKCARAVLSMAPPSRIRCVQSPSMRALPAADLQEIFRSEFERAPAQDFPPLQPLHESIRDALFGPKIPLLDAGTKGRVVVVCGSAFLMSGARAAIGVASPSDE